MDCRAWDDENWSWSYVHIIDATRMALLTSRLNREFRAPRMARLLPGVAWACCHGAR